MVSFIWEKVCFKLIIYLLFSRNYFINTDILLDATSGENVIESLVSEGLASVRQEGIRGSTEIAHLAELESAAKGDGKGKWASSGLQDHVREIKWTVDNPR